LLLGKSAARTAQTGVNHQFVPFFIGDVLNTKTKHDGDVANKVDLNNEAPRGFHANKYEIAVMLAFRNAVSLLVEMPSHCKIDDRFLVIIEPAVQFAARHPARHLRIREIH
jgi:hypothetical protein